MFKGILKNKNLISIISISVLFLVSIIGYSLTVANKVNGKFRNEGYILTSSTASDQSEANEYQQEYFKANESYSPKWPDKISFKNKDGKNVTTSIDQFVHYANGDMEALKDGVILDADKLNTKPLTYYNLKAGSLIKKNGTRYEIQNGNEKLEMSNIIWKISDQKFMFVSSNTTLNRENQAPNSFDNFVEFEFVDGGIVKLSNDKQKAMTIAPNTSLKMQNNVSLDLTTKAIVNGENTKLLSLQQMVIDSNDNVNIEQNNNFGGGSSSGGNSGNGSNNNGSSGSGDNNSGGGSSNGSSGSGEDLKFPNFDATQNDPGTIPDGTPLDKQNIILPSFIMNKFTISAISVSADFVVEDPQTLLSADTKVAVYESSTNKLVYDQNFSSGQFEFTASTDLLKPNTNYTMTLTATYTYKGQEYQRDFVTRGFKTDSIGISYDKNYISRNEASWRVKLDSSSLISSADFVLYDQSGQIQGTKSIVKSEAEKEEGQTIVFDKLKSNSSYKVAVRKVSYNGSLLVTEYDEGKFFLTLKELLTPGDVKIFMDKRNSTFDMSVAGFNDPQGGVKGISYGIYSPSDPNKPIQSVNKNLVNNQSFVVDNSKIKRNTPYIFKATYLFDDNEKIIEYSTLASVAYQMDGTTFPVVNLIAEDIRFDSFKAKLEIDNSSNSLEISKNLTIKIHNSSNISIPDTSVSLTGLSGTNIIKEEMITGLRANETHRLSIYGTVDLQDGNGAMDVLLREVNVTTTKPNPFKVKYIHNKDADKSLSIDLKLEDGDSTNKSEYEASKMGVFKLELYEGESRNPIHKLGKDLILQNSENPKFNLKEELYDSSKTITETDFAVNSDKFGNSKYSLFITRIADATLFENEIGIVNSYEKYTFTPKIALPTITNQNDYFYISYIRNNDNTPADTSLKADTIVGVNVKPKFDNKDKILREYTITPQILYNGVWTDLTNAQTISKTQDDFEISSTRFDIGKGIEYSADAALPDSLKNSLVRGYKYRFKFAAKLDLTLEDDNTKYVDFPPKQAAPFSDKITPDSINPRPTTQATELLSSEVEVGKQDPIIHGLITEWNNFSSSQTATHNKIITQLTIKDPDNNLIKNQEFKLVEAGVANATIPSLGTPNNGVYNVTFTTNGSNGLKEIKSVTKNKVSLATNQETTLFKYNRAANKTTDMQNLQYTAKIDNNLTLDFSNANNNSKIQKIAALNVKLYETNDENNKKEWKNLLLNQQKKLVLSLVGADNLKRKTLTVEVETIYDNEHVKELDKNDSNSAPWVLAKIDNNTGNTSYYKYDKTTQTASWSTDLQGAFWNKMWYTGNIVKMKNPGTDLLNNTERTFTVRQGEGFLTGIQENDANVKVLAKKLTKVALTKKVNALQFQAILPTVSGFTALSAASDLDVSFTLQNPAGTDALYGNKVFVTLYKSSDNSEVAKKELSYTSTDYSNQTLRTTFDSLDPDTRYYIKITGKIDSSSETDLFDTQYQESGKKYPVSTSSKVQFSNFNASIKATGRTDDKYKVELSYNVSQIRGYNKITYEIHEKEANGTFTKLELGDLNTVAPFSSTTMKKEITINKTAKFTYGKKYKIIMKALSVTNQNFGDFQQEFELRELSEPFVSNTYSNGNNSGSIVINPLILDSEFAVKTGKYKIRLYDGTTEKVINNITGDSVEHDISNNSSKTLTGLEENKTYTLKFEMQLDRKRNDTLTNFTKEFEIKRLGQNEIDLGLVNASFTTDNKIKLIFSGSSGLEKVNFVEYSIYKNGTNNAVINGKQDNVSFNINGDLKEFTINHQISGTGVYKVRVVFKNAQGEQLAEYSGIAVKSRSLFSSIFSSFFKSVTLINRHKFNI